MLLLAKPLSEKKGLVFPDIFYYRLNHLHLDSGNNQILFFAAD